MTTVRLMAATVVSALTLAIAPGAQAETLLFLNGFLNPPLADATTVLGGRYSTGNTATIDYPHYSPFLGHAINTGINNLDAVIKSTPGKITVVGYSEGAAIADGEMRRLAMDPAAPPRENLEFVIIEDPLRPGGFMYSLFPIGTWIPILDLHILPPPEPIYDLTIVIQEYDGIADWPDRPWNLISVFNAIIGTGALTPFLQSPHGAGVTADLDAVPDENITVEHHAIGTTTTTYLVPTANLPLTDVFRIVLPDGWVDVIDQVLRPIVDAGYSRNDAKATSATNSVSATDAPGGNQSPEAVAVGTSPTDTHAETAAAMADGRVRPNAAAGAADRKANRTAARSDDRASEEKAARKAARAGASPLERRAESTADVVAGRRPVPKLAPPSVSRRPSDEATATDSPPESPSSGPSETTAGSVGAA